MTIHPAVAAAETRLIRAEIEFQEARASGDPVRIEAAQLATIFADSSLHRARLNYQPGFQAQQERSNGLYHVAR